MTKAAGVHSTQCETASKADRFNPPMLPPAAPGRRRFLAAAAAVAAGGAAIGAVPFIVPIRAAAASPVATGLPVHLTASDPLRVAADNLAFARRRLELARAEVDRGLERVEAWRSENPAPSSKRGLRRWTRRLDAVRSAMTDSAWGRQIAAENAFRAAQIAAAQIDCSGLSDLTQLATLATRYDGEDLAIGQTAPIARAVAGAVLVAFGEVV